jgi:hypothetical protein
MFGYAHGSGGLERQSRLGAFSAKMGTGFAKEIAIK